MPDREKYAAELRRIFSRELLMSDIEKRISYFFPVNGEYFLIHQPSILDFTRIGNNRNTKELKGCVPIAVKSFEPVVECIESIWDKTKKECAFQHIGEPQYLVIDDMSILIFESVLSHTNYANYLDIFRQRANIHPVCVYKNILVVRETNRKIENGYEIWNKNKRVHEIKVINPNNFYNFLQGVMPNVHI